MPDKPTNETDEFLAKLDLTAIADPGDKVRECEYFLALASNESSRERFRWLITAFLNAVYSFFETSALYANAAFTHPETGDPIADDEALEKLRAYVNVFTNAKNPYFVKTSGLNPALQRLYKVRAAAAHHFPLSIVAAGQNLPEDYRFGSLRGEGVPVLELCREALEVVREVDKDLNS